jgi:hypothetical protein
MMETLAELPLTGDQVGLFKAQPGRPKVRRLEEETKSPPIAGLEAGRGVEKHSNGMPPNLLAHYCYLWKPTAVQQAVETAWISSSVRWTFVEVLVPAG